MPDLTLQLTQYVPIIFSFCVFYKAVRFLRIEAGDLIDVVNLLVELAYMMSGIFQSLCCSWVVVFKKPMCKRLSSPSLWLCCKMVGLLGGGSYWEVYITEECILEGGYETWFFVLFFDL